MERLVECQHCHMYLACIFSNTVNMYGIMGDNGLPDMFNIAVPTTFNMTFEWLVYIHVRKIGTHTTMGLIPNPHLSM